MEIDQPKKTKERNIRERIHELFYDSGRVKCGLRSTLSKVISLKEEEESKAEDISESITLTDLLEETLRNMGDIEKLTNQMDRELS